MVHYFDEHEEPIPSPDGNTQYRRLRRERRAAREV